MNSLAIVMLITALCQDPYRPTGVAVGVDSNCIQEVVSRAPKDTTAAAILYRRYRDCHDHSQRNYGRDEPAFVKCMKAGALLKE